MITETSKQSYRLRQSDFTASDERDRDLHYTIAREAAHRGVHFKFSSIANASKECYATPIIIARSTLSRRRVSKPPPHALQCAPCQCIVRHRARAALCARRSMVFNENESYVLQRELRTKLWCYFTHPSLLAYSSDLPPNSHVVDASRCAFGTYSYRLDGKVYGKRTEWLMNKWLWSVVFLRLSTFFYVSRLALGILLVLLVVSVFAAVFVPMYEQHLAEGDSILPRSTQRLLLQRQRARLLSQSTVRKR